MKEIRLRDKEITAKVRKLKCDFTPSDMISFIVTDSKIFKPAAISDELIQLYNC